MALNPYDLSYHALWFTTVNIPINYFLAFGESSILSRRFQGHLGSPRGSKKICVYHILVEAAVLAAFEGIKINKIGFTNFIL